MIGTALSESCPSLALGAHAPACLCTPVLHPHVARALHTNELVEHLDNLIERRAIRVPHYDFSSSTHDSSRAVTLEPAAHEELMVVMIVEGLMIFHSVVSHEPHPTQTEPHPTLSKHRPTQTEPHPTLSKHHPTQPQHYPTLTQPHPTQTQP